MADTKESQLSEYAKTLRLVSQSLPVKSRMRARLLTMVGLFDGMSKQYPNARLTDLTITRVEADHEYDFDF